ncbi:MAG: hypothetical protein QOK31_2148 [Solirubrobacteraceae bacterium]|nr:hypothetical protein [Solirubrobacteraceae bacterium]
MSLGPRARDERAQASLEVVAVLPLLLVVALAVAQVLAAGAAAELSRHAAEAGAVALIEGKPGAVAARQSVPGWSRRRMAVSIRGSRVRIRIRPPALTRSLARLLTATADADAGAVRP